VSFQGLMKMRRKGPLDVNDEKVAELMLTIVRFTVNMGKAFAYFIACAILAEVKRAMVKGGFTVVEFWDGLKSAVDTCPVQDE